MPAPKKTRNQQHMLDSFSAERSDASFQIFTDTNARVPVADTSVDNPFYGPGAAPASSVQPSIKRKGKGKCATVTVPGEGKVAIDELVGRDDGMVISFRGKKQYISFADKEDDGSGTEDDSAAAMGIVPVGTPDTPATPRFAPASPPTTARVTRHGSKTNAEASPMKAKTTTGKKNSPLGWRVSKGSYSAKHGVKRPANTDSGSGSPVKRAKA
ncbi:hypothetical protein P8C59_008709 [Phyllachora maydis]|uniref:Uncharacterized protein n=1 Tax=Phyllachora maydis TaxID=1825666 RepID=A0AAD9MFG7_9PEZI|nr:hypothetical protein P8C59_008709 [Phyllachora maydis]